MSDQGKALVEKAYDLDEIRKIFEDASTLSGGVWLGYLLVFFYIGSAVLGVTPRDLLLENPVKLPFLNTELPLVAFFFLAPILFLISHVYALAHFAMVAMKARYFDDELAARLRDEDDIKERVRWLLPSSVFVQFLAGPSYIRKGGVGWLLKAIAWITLVFGPLVLLLMIQVRFLPYHLLSATNTHRFAIMFDFAALAWLWPIVLAGRSETNWPVGWYVPAWSLAYAGTAFLLLTFSFPGEPGVHWFRRGRFYDFLFKGDVFDPATGYPTSIFSNLLVLPEFDALDAAKIDDPKKLDFVKRTMNLRGRHLEGANFGDADLRKVDLSRAYLQGARFVDARLQGAVLRDAKLQGATLDFASLQGASLDDAQLQGASLGGTNLQGASLQGAKLQGASLQAAILQGALLSGAQLQGASLEIAKLQGANFRKSYSYHTYRGYEELVTSTYTDMGYTAVLAGTYMGDAAVWRSSFEGASLIAVFTDGLTESAISKDEFATLKTNIMEEVPEGSERDEALARIEKLNPDIIGPEPSQTQTLGNGRADKAAYQKALADQLKDLVCSGDQYASYIVRGLLTEPVWTFAGTSVSRVADTGPFAPALIESFLAPDCPVSAALTEQDKAELRKLAKKMQPNQSKP